MGGDVYQKVLLTHDGSEVADSAVAHASMIARAAGAELLIVQVIDSVGAIISQTTPMTIEPMPAGQITAQIAQEAVEAQREGARENVERLRARLEGEGLERVSTLILEGHPGPAICEAAAEAGADLVVMATHGRSGIGRVLLGSVADHVVRNTPHSAVLLVRP